MSRTSIQRVIAVGVIAATAIWCVAAGRVIYFAGDNMLGFHPLILLLLPYFGVLLLVAIVSAFLRAWMLLTSAAAAVALIVGLIALAPHIQDWAWRQSVIGHHATNQAALIQMADALPDFGETRSLASVHNDAAMPVVDDFAWYMEHSLAAPDGAFRAFQYRGFAHVRIQKIRHGYRGIVYLPSAERAEQLRNLGSLSYERAIDEHWMIWRTP